MMQYGTVSFDFEGVHYTIKRFYDPDQFTVSVADKDVTNEWGQDMAEHFYSAVMNAQIDIYKQIDYKLLGWEW